MTTTARRHTGFAADPLVPSRELLLDPEFVADRLATILGRSVSSCSLRRAKYRLGESLRVVYNVATDGRQFVMSARTFADSAAAFDRARASTEPVEGMAAVAHDPMTQTVWWTLPNDRRLRNLRTLLDPPSRVRESSGTSWHQSVLVQYAPERSATVELLDAQGQTIGYAKAYRDRDVMDLADDYNHVAAAVTVFDGVRTPRALGWARPDRILVLEAMRGRTWTQLPADLQPQAIQRLGTALGNLHNLPAVFGHGPFERYRVERVVHSADLVGLARGDLAEDARRLSDRLAAEAPGRGPVVGLHGDVHSENVLFHGEEVHIIDFDQGGLGPAAADLGSILASLLTYQLVNPHNAAQGLGGALLHGYRSAAKLPSESDLRWYTAAAFVAERAIRAVNRVNQSTLAVLPDLLALGDEVLAGKVVLDG